MTFPQSQHAPRPPRVRPSEFTPIVLRIQDGSCTTGTLLVFSITGGLLSLPKLLDRGSLVRLMFLVQSGPVLGTAEMLKPVSWTEQPFRFVALHEGDQHRLRTATHLSPKAVAPVFGNKTFTPKTMNLTVPPASVAASPTDREQEWIAKYRAATAPHQHSRGYITRLLSAKVLFASATAATVAAGLVYALQSHLLR